MLPTNLSKKIISLVIVVAMAILPVPVLAVTDTFNPTASDAYIDSTNAVWLTARNATTGTLSDNTALYLQAIFNAGASNYSVLRSLMNFDTSSLPDGATITSATMQFTVSEKVNSNERHYSLYGSTAADTPVADDFNNCDTTANSDSIAQTALPAVDSSFSLTLNETGLAAINKTGLTKFCVREDDYDVTATIPINIAYWAAYSSSGTTPPVLSVTYTLPASGSIESDWLLFGFE